MRIAAALNLMPLLQLRLYLRFFHSRVAFSTLQHLFSEHRFILSGLGFPIANTACSFDPPFATATPMLIFDSYTAVCVVVTAMLAYQSLS